MNDDFIFFKFSGGISDNHELNFYEAARFQYGAARLIYILEEYRQTGRVLEKVSQKIDTDIRLSTPRAGSWELEIALAGVMAIGTCTVKVPLGVLFSYLLNKLKPTQKGKELALELVKQNSKQLEQHTEQIQAIKEIIKSKDDTLKAQIALTEKCLDLLKNTSYKEIHPLTHAIANQDDLDFCIKELEAEKRYYKKISPYHDELCKIPDEKEEQLSAKFRMVAKELAMPLKSSATSLSIGLGTNKGVIVFDEDSLSGLGKEVQDSTPSSLLGSVKAYDKETGWGKYRRHGHLKPIPFYVTGAKKNKSKNKILKAMASEETMISFYPIRNLNGQIIRLLFDKVIQISAEE